MNVYEIIRHSQGHDSSSPYYRVPTSGLCRFILSTFIRPERTAGLRLPPLRQCRREHRHCLFQCIDHRLSRQRPRLHQRFDHRGDRRHAQAQLP
jgi:hypothetical protein